MSAGRAVAEAYRLAAQARHHQDHYEHGLAETLRLEIELYERVRRIDHHPLDHRGQPIDPPRHSLVADFDATRRYMMPHAVTAAEAKKALLSTVAGLEEHVHLLRLYEERGARVRGANHVISEFMGLIRRLQLQAPPSPAMQRIASAMTTARRGGVPLEEPSVDRVYHGQYWTELHVREKLDKIERGGMMHTLVGRPGYGLMHEWRPWRAPHGLWGLSVLRGV